MHGGGRLLDSVPDDPVSESGSTSLTSSQISTSTADGRDADSAAARPATTSSSQTHPLNPHLLLHLRLPVRPRLPLRGERPQQHKRLPPPRPRPVPLALPEPVRSTQPGEAGFPPRPKGPRRLRKWPQTLEEALEEAVLTPVVPGMPAGPLLAPERVPADPKKVWPAMPERTPGEEPWRRPAVAAVAKREDDELLDEELAELLERQRLDASSKAAVAGAGVGSGDPDAGAPPLQKAVEAVGTADPDWDIVEHADASPANPGNPVPLAGAAGDGDAGGVESETDEEWEVVDDAAVVPTLRAERWAGRRFNVFGRKRKGIAGTDY